MIKGIETEEAPIIDWDLGIKLAGGKKEIAKDLLGYLVKKLPEEITIIKNLQSQNNYSKLVNFIHKLHGAICYCGAPRLKKAVASLETDLKNNIMISSSLCDQLYIEADLLLKEYLQTSSAQPVTAEVNT